MNLAADQITFEKQGETFTLRVAGEEEAYDVHRVVRVFPQSQPGAYVSFLDGLGHEVGLLENMDGMDRTSRALLEDLLREQYFVPTVHLIQTVERIGSGSNWVVETERGQAEFRIGSRDALNGDTPPSIVVASSDGRRYRIPDYWALDRESRELINDMLPDKILKYRLARPRSETVGRKR